MGIYIWGTGCGASELMAQGIGLALSEDFDDLTKHTSLKGCGIPYPKDIPDDIELHYVETYRPEGPLRRCRLRRGSSGCSSPRSA